MNTNAAIRKAIPILAEHGSNPILRVLLLRAGLSRGQTTNAERFIPLAFGRTLLAGMGVNLPDSYVRLNGPSQEREERNLADEEFFREALAIASTIAITLGQEVFTAIALQSSEVSAVNQALNHGASAEDLVMSPPVVMWDEDADGAAAAQKPWWKVW